MQNIQLAEQLYLSRSHFQKLFRDCIGMTPSRYHAQYRNK
ncbi:AraC family transcriptional regulator [Ructibacterium gallinarum]|uniref:AraC family transcriptional regulator n=1 Tax=Ructibacterium gallinarum TaxID=2779355 RepID=A0A9D5M015_9FIRM|nr:AraC family transcriptional regulator [Ructibacterium gallinarum]